MSPIVQMQKLRPGEVSQGAQESQNSCQGRLTLEVKRLTYLEIQWLRYCALAAGGSSLIPGWGTKILHALR